MYRHPFRVMHLDTSLHGLCCPGYGCFEKTTYHFFKGIKLIFWFSRSDQMANCDLRSEYKTRLLRLTGPNAAVKFNRKYKFYHQGAAAQSFLILERKENANNFDAL